MEESNENLRKWHLQMESTFLNAAYLAIIQLNVGRCYRRRLMQTIVIGVTTAVATLLIFGPGILRLIK